MGWFTPSFNAVKTTTALKLCLGRIRLIQNKKRAQLLNIRREISHLIEDTKYDSARIRVETVLREKNMLLALEMLELYTELISVRIRLLEQTQGVPGDMGEAIASVIYASSRMGDVPELSAVVQGLGMKFGKDFVLACKCNDPSELPRDVREKCPENPRSWVHQRLVHALNVSPPSLEDRIAELQSIASDHNIHMDLDKAVQAMKMSAGGISTPLIDVSDADVPVSARPNNPDALADMYGGSVNGGEVKTPMYRGGEGAEHECAEDPLHELRTQLCHAADEVRVTAQAAADAAREAAAAAARYESLRREYERRGGLPVWGGAGGSGSAAGGSSKGGDGARGVPGSDGDALPPRLFDWAGEQGGKGGAQPQGSEARVSLEASAPEWDENRLVEGEGTGDGAVDGVRVVEGRPVGRMANSDLPDLPDVGQLSAPGKSIDPDELPTSFGVRHDKGKGVEGDAGGEEDADEKLDDLMLRFARLKSRDRD